MVAKIGWRRRNNLALLVLGALGLKGCISKIVDRTYIFMQSLAPTQVQLPAKDSRSTQCCIGLYTRVITRTQWVLG